MKIDELIGGYIALREKKAAIKKRYENEVEVIDQTLTMIENTLLAHLNKVGADSIKTSAGTAYKSTATTASVADWDAFLHFVKTEGSWEMLQRAVNKTAVAQYKEANSDLPPGVNWREVINVNFRKS